MVGGLKAVARGVDASPALFVKSHYCRSNQSSDIDRNTSKSRMILVTINQCRDMHAHGLRPKKLVCNALIKCRSVSNTL